MSPVGQKNGVTPESGNAANPRKKQTGPAKVASGATAPVVESEEPLQAVILAEDGYDDFLPLTLDMPRCLLPLCNRPLIDYTLESMAMSQVEEVYIVIEKHAAQLQAYLAASRWKKINANKTMKIEVIQVQQCRSVGDFLREVDARSIIRSDFILVMGDLVTNVSLTPIFEEHQRQRELDKNMLLTMVLRTALPRHPCRTMTGDPLLLLDPTTKQLLAYESIDGFSDRCSLDFSASLLSSSSSATASTSYEVRYDLTDCHVDVCSPMVLNLFTENFDFQDPRRDLLKDVLTSELVDFNVYTSILQEGFMLRAQHPWAYHHVSTALMERWAYPLVPEANIDEENSAYTYRRPHIYVDTDVSLGRSAVLTHCVMIGRGSRIGENTVITNSVLGPYCQIGDGVRLDGVHLLGHVTVGNNCVLQQCILSEHVQLRPNTVIDKGCLIGRQVHLGPNRTVRAHITCTRAPRKTKAPTKPSSTGPSLTVGSWGDDDDEEEEENEGEEEEEEGVLDEMHHGERKGVYEDRSAVAMATADLSQTQEGPRAYLGWETTLPASYDTSLVGEQGRGYLYCGTDERHLDATQKFRRKIHRMAVDRDALLYTALQEMALRERQRLQEEGEEEEDEDEEDEDEEEENHEEEALQSHHQHRQTESEMKGWVGEIDDASVLRFTREAEATVMRAIQEQHQLHDTRPELNTLKMAYNVSFRDLFRAVLPSILVAHVDRREQLLAAVQKYAPLLAEYVRCLDDTHHAIQLIRDTCHRHPSLAPYFIKILLTLYQENVLDEEAILRYYHDITDSTVLAQMKPFVDWLQEEEDEDEEEEDEDE